MFLAIKSNKLFWIIPLIGILISVYYWLSFRLFSNLTQFWLVGILLSFALTFILHKFLKLWQIPILVFSLDLVYHYIFTSSGEVAIAYYLVEIPFIVLTILFTIWIYIVRLVKNGVIEGD
ncbi:hypothetical protein Desor_1526 [Desulfosporosinus orientis DSM 765]|uniref:Uncharacterized protein n=1 Tax=Desulfosporosinus orientis (strain ATCC 19365 / DSM 765 / NCIMB 8382 / VKM B-1628 / Singapore I) TaxID=768706 RepID=G7WAW6_DESOD|nr:hypothetical protein [Desulfosporosinus orientis]AET67177.1 hypothetical protein Desor_1526 [Desulfosporosinus orientis DSM 765]